MLKIENTKTVGWEEAVRGMRNPMNSWGNSDSGWDTDYFNTTDYDSRVYVDYDGVDSYFLGPNDVNLMMKLRDAGTDHRKFMRMITVYMDITAPLYWWKEFDTYKVGTVANSCSTMHKISAKEFTLDDFSHEHLLKWDCEMADAFELVATTEDGKELSEGCCSFGYLTTTIRVLNFYRDRYIKTKDKKYWWQMIQLLPSSYNQRRTVMLNYEVLANMYKSRKDHKLDEWHSFCDEIRAMPYSELIIGGGIDCCAQ